MKTLAALVTLLGVYSCNQASKQLRQQTLTFLYKDCPPDTQVVCVDDINRAIPICEKAAEEKGKDFNADLDCVKYFVSADKDCWGCICVIAEKNHIKIKGCDKYLME